MSGTSIGVMTIQIGYTAATSRALTPSAFGAYAVALSGIGVLGMLGGSSLGQAAARREHDSESNDRSLVSLALLMGAVMAALAFLLAPLWGLVWDAPDSTSVTRVFAVSIPFTSVASVLAGILRRRGSTHIVAVRGALGQVLGMGVGLAAVLSVRQPWSLAVSAVAGAAISCILLSLSLTSILQKPQWPAATAFGDVVYGIKAAGMNLLRSANGALSAWAISRFSGAASLGGFNRATTLVTIPLQQFQVSFNYALFPELRPGGPAFSHRRTFTRILILITWPATIAATVGYFAAPAFITVLLGPDWGVAAGLAGLALLLGVLSMISVPLGSAVEALGLFRVAALAWLMALPLLALGIAATIRTQSPAAAMLGMLAAILAGASVNGVGLNRRGLLDTGLLLRGVAPIVIVQMPMLILFWATSSVLEHKPVLLLVGIIFIGMVEVGIVWRLQSRTEFGRLAAQAHLPGFRTEG